MRVLLDTHAFLWWIMNDERLSGPSRKVISQAENQIFFSAASAWEISIKCQLGKLELPGKPEPFISEQVQVNNFTALPINLTHALQVFELPALHRDPFDRMLVVQSRVERLPVLTMDEKIRQYEVETIW